MDPDRRTGHKNNGTATKHPMRSLSTDKSRRLLQAEEIVGGMSKETQQDILIKSLSTGGSIRDILQDEKHRDEHPKHAREASTIGTTTTSPSVASDRLEAIHEALETPSQSREWSHAKIKSQSDPPKTECSNSDKFAAIAPPAGGATPSSQIINHGGTINIYYNTCQGHPSNGTNQNASVECAPDENTTFDRAFVQPPSAPISEVVRYSDQTMLDSSIFSTVPDTDVSIAEKRFIQDGVVLILDGASDRAVIFKAISKLVEKTITEKWDLELRAYVPLEPAIAEDIRRRLEEDSDVNIDRNGLVSPPSASAWDTVRPGQWIEQRRRCNRSNKNDDTRVNFSDLNSSGFEPEEMDNGTPSRGLRVPPHNPPQPRHSPWTKAKDNLAQNEGMMPDDSSLVLYNSTDADLDRLILSPSSNADEHAPAPRKDPEILAKVLKGPKEATSKLINLRGRTANPPPGENSTTGPAVGTGAKDRSSTQPNRHMTRASSKLEEAGESRATSILPPAVVEGGRKVKRKKKKKKPAKAGADVVEKCTSENTDGSGSRDDRRRTARTAALDSIARLALEAGPEASQQASEGNFSFLLGPTSENRRCRLCRQMFTDQTNVRQEDGSAPCSYHPGKLENKRAAGNTLAFACCGGPPVVAGPGAAIVNLVSPGCVSCYHQDKKSAWSLDTLTMADPILFEAPLSL